MNKAFERILSALLVMVALGLLAFFWAVAALLVSASYLWLSGTVFENASIYLITMSPLIVAVVFVLFWADRNGKIREKRYPFGHWSTWAFVGWLTLPINLNGVSKAFAIFGWSPMSEIIFNQRYHVQGIIFVVAVLLVGRWVWRFLNSRLAA